jgi:hypothetical protein
MRIVLPSFYSKIIGCSYPSIMSLLEERNARIGKNLDNAVPEELRGEQSWASEASEDE